MKKINPALTVILALIAAPTLAQDTSSRLLAISDRDCQRLVLHRPDADVYYKPGVDVRGNPVAPADVPGQARIAVPGEITIRVTVDLLQRHGVPAESPLAPRGEAAVGTVVYDTLSGRLTYDGQALNDPEQDALAAACRDAATKK